MFCRWPSLSLLSFSLDGSIAYPKLAVIWWLSTNKKLWIRANCAIVQFCGFVFNRQFLSVYITKNKIQLPCIFFLKYFDYPYSSLFLVCTPWQIDTVQNNEDYFELMKRRRLRYRLLNVALSIDIDKVRNLSRFFKNECKKLKISNCPDPFILHFLLP